MYIQSVKLNGKNWNKAFIPVEEVLKGGELTFTMGSKPNTKWGTEKDSVPPSINK
jgi:putative alpha-1,2-mannosidase